ncbi:MAG: prepilin-type N-terminal cleavage/methylation domain-containing protein [Rubrivivax sp.]
MKRTRGFTLVEVLVALVVMALMAALAWRGLDGVLRARDAGRDAVDRTMRLATLLQQFETDVQALQMDDTVPSALTFDGRTLRLLRRHDAGLQLVLWTLEGSTWLRWAARPATTVSELQQTWMRSQQTSGLEPAPLRLLEGVTDFQVYCIYGNSVSNCQSSRDQEASPAAATAAAAAAAASAASGAGGTVVPAVARSADVLPGGVRLVLQLEAGSITRDLAIAPGQ